MTDPTNPPAASLLPATKLPRPQPSTPLVLCPCLLEASTAGFSERLTLISAPAGYGKTTLVNQWLDSVDRPAARVSLDEHAGDLATFLSYLLAAIRSVYPDANLTTELFAGPHAPFP